MGQSQSWDPERYARHARFVAELGMPTVELLAPIAGERILDLGCGDGVLTESFARWDAAWSASIRARRRSPRRARSGSTRA